MAGSKRRETDNLSVKHGDGHPLQPEEKKLAPVRHGLYLRPEKVQVDGRSFLARRRKKLKVLFLADFPTPPSPRIQAIADTAAVNWICLEGFRAAFLRGEAISPSAWKDYTALCNSLSRDLLTLEQLAKGSSGKDSIPDLEEYLETLKKAGKATPAVVKVKAKQEGPAAPKESVRKGPLF